MYKIAVLPGDGIGPEIVPEAVKVLEAVSRRVGIEFQFTEALVGGAAIDAVGIALPPETLELCRQSDAVLLGAVGGPKWDTLPPAERPETAALLPLRKELGLYANLRPAFLYDSLVEASPLKKEIVTGTDLIIVRELTGGLYFGAKKREQTAEGEMAYDTMYYTRAEIERIVRLAFTIARQRRCHLTSVDKANVLTTSRLWRDTVEDIKGEFPEVTVEHMYVDNCAMQLVRRPAQFDVIVTENTFGDILSDQASVLTGSIGMLPSASIGGAVALYEPCHGSAPDIAGQQKANPLATILSAAMMLKYSFKMDQAAAAIEAAVGRVLAKGYRTPDLYVPGTQLVGTAEMGQLVRRELEEG
ncbi:3-isopropylmalate dehydrogenase [Neomoorella thermoacetica]|uniref:3-isopropylmalate dehydrogenase n=1 Tax=Neomoorella thermoacetica TaxID=1525 RepID=UPI0008FAC5EC|nr:3-isopropylmalate dehydrogenase [Moorella thermoacetica]OIQ10560.1 3-isopropylmalate dehydrogenase [Moorella thermoacetica]